MATLRRWVGAALLTVASAATLAACGESFEVNASRQVTAELAVAGEGSIRIDLPAGEVTIRDDAEGRILVTGELIGRGATKERAEARVGKMQLALESGENGAASLRLLHDGHNPAVDLEIRIPRGFELRAYLAAGRLVAAVEPSSSTQLDLEAGEVIALLPDTAAVTVDARTTVGEVTVSGFSTRQGEAKRVDIVGAVFEGTIGDPNEAASRQLRLRNQAGAIRLRPQG